ncbi:MAG TPA: ABC transporter ATP-binding protein [Pseudomonadales bacterium]
MLTVSNLSRSYGSFLAVDTVSFTIRPGEIVGLLGHNGAGKTTIMKMLSGYLEPDAGSICVDGVDVGLDAKQMQRQLGYLPENLPVYPEMTVADYLDYAADLKGLQGDLKTAEIRRAVQATDIGSKILAPIATLSRGYKQRVGVAQAILGKPRFLILDEPTNGLDPTQTEHMRKLIRELAQHATVILSTHIMQEVEALCDRVLIVKGGRLVVDAALANLRQARELELVTNLDTGAVRAALSATPVKALRAAGGNDGAWRGYRLEVDGGSDLHDAAAGIAAAIIAASGHVAALQPVVRNLETLFRDVSEATEEKRHAA